MPKSQLFRVTAKYNIIRLHHSALYIQIQTQWTDLSKLGLPDNACSATGYNWWVQTTKQHPRVSSIQGSSIHSIHGIHSVNSCYQPRSLQGAGKGLIDYGLF